MKIAISSSGKETSSLLDPRFGRCAFFAIYDSQKDEWNFLPNRASMEGSGAGVKAAQFLLDQNVDVILTGNLGPNASQILSASGSKVYSLPEVPLEEAVKLYDEGKGRLITESTVDSHTGLASSSGSAVEEPAPPAPSEGKFAVATDGALVAQHFGRCPSYTLVEIKDGKAVNKNLIPNPGHQPGFLPRFLAEKGVKCVIAGGMGPRAQDLFAQQGIDTVVGVVGPVDDAIENFISNSLVGGASLCGHEQGGEGHGDHECGNQGQGCGEH